jgi:HEAT repeat protein
MRATISLSIPRRLAATLLAGALIVTLSAPSALAQGAPAAKAKAAHPRPVAVKQTCLKGSTWAGKRCFREAFPGLPAPAKKFDVAQGRADLGGTDVEKASMAARRLAMMGGPAALQVLLDALAGGLDPEVAAVAVKAVGALRSPASIDVLAGYLHHRRPVVRAAAVWALGQIDDKRAVALAYQGLADQEKEVRAAACLVVEERKDPAQADALVTLLLKGDDAVATALAAIATPDLARKLAELFGRAPDQLLGKTLGLIVLRTDLGKEDTYVELINAIAKIPGDEAVNALTSFIARASDGRPAKTRAKQQLEQRTGGDK